MGKASRDKGLNKWKWNRRVDRLPEKTRARREAFLVGPIDCEWRVINRANRYEISEYGDIRTLYKSRTRMPGHVVKGQMRGGYRAVKLINNDGSKETFWVHRLVALAFVGEQPSPIHIIAHGDGVRLNNHKSNLRWATPKENAADSVKHGTNYFQWRTNPKTKLDPQKVIKIRDDFSSGRADKSELMEKYDIGETALSYLLSGKNWAHV